VVTANNALEQTVEQASGYGTVIVAGRSTRSLAGWKMRRIAIVALAVIAGVSALADASNVEKDISNAEARKIVRKGRCASLELSGFREQS
jgi:hypothetical protein